jgi:pyrroloquinoline quinone biosynthesis protein D
VSQAQAPGTPPAIPAIGDATVPRLARGCRLAPKALAPEATADDRVLLMPEGLLKLSETGLRILVLCDGRRTLAMIVAELAAAYPGAPGDRIRADVADYLGKLALKKAVELA